ncbi:MAG: ExeM/NucH family extracellular endonuclease [Gaiellaceae bacterium]
MQEAAGTTTSPGPLPTPDIIDATPINMSGTGGKVALVADSASLGCNGGSAPCSVAQLALIVDLVGWDGANFFEGPAPAPATTNPTAVVRNDGGCTDTDSNAADFTVATPTPRNTLSPFHGCVAVDLPPSVVSTVPANGAAGVALDGNVTVTFSEPVDVADGWFTLACTAGGTRTATVTGGPTVFTIDPDANLRPSDSCTLTVHGADVTDQDGAPDAMSGDFAATFTTAEGCGSPYTPIPAIQGSGPTAAITGPVTTEGVVVGDYEGASPNLRGFFVEDPTGDGNPATSDGIFVFEGSNANTVSVGDAVRLSGNAGENQGQTQISVGTITACGTGTVAPADVTLPFTSLDFPERYEGMLVRMPQTLYVTEHFQLGRFGQVVMSAGDRLFEPTSLVSPGAAAIAMQAQNDLDRIIVDDDSQTQNPDPILFGRGGDPLSAANTLRGGDTATGMVAVMTYTWAGNSASGNAYRLRPVGALGGGVPDFVAANARPESPPAVGGTVRVAGMNLLNFFNTFDGASSSPPYACTGGVGGELMDCRGADDPGEFARQWPKTVAAIVGTGADVIGFAEMENDGYGPDSAVAFLVDRLNEATAPGTYAYIDVDAATGQVNALGTDAIKVGVLYKPARVTPVGTTAALNSVEFVNGGDSAPRNRPALAQAFRENATGETFVVSPNHLKSKGSACDLPDSGDGQANCAAVRTNAANLLASWLAGDPTGTGAAGRTLIVGDLNSYAKEDPIAALESDGFTNLISSRIGAHAYSYVFDGQWGYLDYALGSAGILSDVTGVGEWHINADEPSVLDYNDDFKTAGQIVSLYAPDQYRISDHDPVLVGLALHPTVEGMCTLVRQFVTKNEGLRNSLCVKLQNGAYGAFVNEVRAQSGKALTTEQAALLEQRVGLL